MARSSHSRSRSPGPWRARDRGGAGAMAFVGPPPSRLRGSAGSRPSRVTVGEQHEKMDGGHRGAMKGKASGEDFYSSRGAGRAGGGGGVETQKQRGPRSWQPHAGGGGTRATRNNVEEAGDAGGEGGVASRKGPIMEGRDSRRVRNSSSNRRPNHRGDTRGGGAPVAATFHGYAPNAAAALPYDKRSASTWGQRRDNMHAGTATDDAYAGGAGPPAAAAAVPAPYEGDAARDAESRVVNWGGDRPQQEEAGNSYFYYYQGGGSNTTTVDAHQQQQQYGGLPNNGSGGTRLHRAPSVFEGGPGSTVPGSGTADLTRGGGGTFGGAGSAGNKGGQGEDMEEQLLHRPLLNFKQFVVMKPDDCTQKELSRAYELYVERHKKYHAEQFFEKHGGDAFMRELYHPNLRRRQHDLRKARAKILAQAFLQRFQDGFFSGLALEADSKELRHFYDHMEEDSPLLLRQWPSSATIFARGSSRREEDRDAEVVEVEDDGPEGEEEKRDDVFGEQREGRDGGEEVMQERRRQRRSAAARSSRRSSSVGSAAAAAVASSGDEAVAGGSSHSERRTAASPSHHNKRWPPFVLLPSPADCLVIHAVDPSISSLEIFDELASQGVAEVAMVTEGDNPTDPRTAFVFFSSSEAKRNYQQRSPDMIVKLTKPVVTVGVDGEEQETLKVFSLSLREPPMPSSSLEVWVTPPAACTPARLRKDLETSAALIVALDRQLGVFEEGLNADGMQHPLLSSFPESWSTQKRLDMQITYLRHVHALCYYSGELCKNLVDVNMRCRVAYLRPRLPGAAQQAMYLQLQQQQQHTSSTVLMEDVEGGASSDEEEREGVNVWERRDTGRRNSKSGLEGGSSSSAKLPPSSTNGTDEDEQQEGEMEDEGKKSKRNEEMSCVAYPQQRWMRQLDRKLRSLLKKIEKLQEDLPAALAEETPIISLKWNAFCHEKVFEDDEHKHRCRLCNKPFKAPHFVFKHLRKKHEEELNFIIERYATIVMKETYMKDEGKPLVVTGGGGTKGEAQSSGGGRDEETSLNAESVIRGPQYAWGYGPPLRAPPSPAPIVSASTTVGGWPGGMPPPAGSPPPAAPPSMSPVGVPPPYGPMFMPERSLPAPGAHPVYAVGTPGGGGVLSTHPVAHPSSQYYPFGGGVVPPHVVYDGAGVANFGAPSSAVAFRRRDWDAPEPVVAGPAPMGGAGRQANGARRLASYADL